MFVDETETVITHLRLVGLADVDPVDVVGTTRPTCR